jgi:hypothetical protein
MAKQTASAIREKEEGSRGNSNSRHSLMSGKGMEDRLGQERKVAKR